MITISEGKQNWWERFQQLIKILSSETFFGIFSKHFFTLWRTLKTANFGLCNIQIHQTYCTSEEDTDEVQGNRTLNKFHAPDWFSCPLFSVGSMWAMDHRFHFCLEELTSSHLCRHIFIEILSRAMTFIFFMFFGILYALEFFCFFRYSTIEVKAASSVFSSFFL